MGGIQSPRFSQAPPGPLVCPLGTLVFVGHFLPKCHLWLQTNVIQAKLKPFLRP